jgi:lactoylglutathione lyase
MTDPTRILYTMLRVGDLDRSIAFYRDVLGMQEVRRETFPEARFTLVFMGYGEASSHALIELTWNWDEKIYSHGTGYGHVALEVADLEVTCRQIRQSGGVITRPPGPMRVAPVETGIRENIAFLKDPDGYKIELIEAG